MDESRRSSSSALRPTVESLFANNITVEHRRYRNFHHLQDETVFNAQGRWFGRSRYPTQGFGSSQGKDNRHGCGSLLPQRGERGGPGSKSATARDRILPKRDDDGEIAGV